MRWSMLGLVVVCGFTTAAQADELQDQAYAAGQFAGASTFCGVPRGDVNALSKAMLEAFGVDISGPNPAMTKFTEGVTAGMREQKDAPQATCDEVKQGFAQMKSNM